MTDWRRTSSGRIRTPWRLLLSLSLFFSTVLVISVTVAFTGVVSPPDSTATDPFALVVPQVIVGVALAFVTVVAAVYIDRRSLETFGLSFTRRWWSDLVFGLALGFGLVAGAYLAGIGLGVYEPRFAPAAPDGYTLVRAFALVAAFTCAVGVYEELLFRGYLLPNLADGFRAVLGARSAVLGSVALSSVGFGAVHGFNPGMTPLGTATITAAGVALALGYVLTGRLALPIGFHITWNFAHFVFGLPVSGIDLGIRLLRTERSGSALVHGGAVGPEGGLVGLGAALVGCLAVVAYAGLIANDTDDRSDGGRPTIASTILYDGDSHQ